MENTFATFTPIQLNPSPSKEEIAEYYKANNILLDNDYLNNKFGLTPPTPTSQVATTEPFKKDYNIKDILSNIAQKAKATVKPSESEIPSTTTNTVSKMTKSEFIKAFGPGAEAASKKTGISKDLLLAQIALETGWGKSTPGNNIGGIKADKNWTGKKQTLKTKEQGASGLEDRMEPFRVYETLEEGIAGYGDFLATNKRYNVLKGITDPYKAADVMGTTGYATDPNYAQKLKNVLKSLETA